LAAARRVLAVHRKALVAEQAADSEALLDQTVLRKASAVVSAARRDRAVLVEDSAAVAQLDPEVPDHNRVAPAAADRDGDLVEALAAASVDRPVRAHQAKMDSAADKAPERRAAPDRDSAAVVADLVDQQAPVGRVKDLADSGAELVVPPDQAVVVSAVESLDRVVRLAACE